jgi:LPS export ABC transporter protein LptC
MAGILFSCSNDLDNIRKVTFDPNAPDDITKNVSMYYTDSGYARVNIYAAIAETYSKPEHITKLKDTVKIDFYNEFGVITTSLTAKYGEVNYSTGEFFVQDSVRLVNIKDKRELRTKKLTWNQKDSTIYSDDDVIVKSPKGIGYGTSIKTKQDFSYYKLTDPRGKYEFNEND